MKEKEGEIMKEKEGKYFVVNEDNLDSSPRQMFFSLGEAQDDGAEMIDVFDDKGKKVCYYEKDGKEYKYIEIDYCGVN